MNRYNKKKSKRLYIGVFCQHRFKCITISFLSHVYDMGSDSFTLESLLPLSAFNLLQHGVKWEQTFLGFFLVPYRRQPKGTIVLGSVRLPVRHIKILSCPDFFLTSFDILT
jgi:hypothetical protein